MSFDVDHQQYMLNTESPRWRGDLGMPGRWRAVRLVMEAEGLLDRWCYRKYLWPILARYQATEASTCQDICHSEKILLQKSGMLRGVLEQLNRPLDPQLGLIAVSGGARLADVRTVALNIEMSMGADGLAIEQFPVPGFRNYILVKVLDADVDESSRGGYHYAKTATGNEYAYYDQFFHDPRLADRVAPTAELAAKLARGPLPELAGRPLNREARIVAPSAPSSLQVELAELEKKLKVAEMRLELSKLEAMLEAQLREAR